MQDPENIPMLDLSAQFWQLQAEITARLNKALHSGQFILGPNVHAFEQQAADYLGVAHAISCASGTDALHLALRAAGIGPGDEVITTPFTFIATAEAIHYVGAKAVFVDIEQDTFNINPQAVADAITENTKAILPVHLFGQPANLPALQDLATQHQLRLIEDCAQCFGADIQQRFCGSIGDLGCFSFFPSKNLGCYGDGGMVSTSSDELAEQLRIYRNHGSPERYYHTVVGYNSRLDELQAVILRIKLKYIDQYNQQRRRVAQHYRAFFADTPLILPQEDGIGTHVFHQYTVRLPAEYDRERVMAKLQQQGVASAIYYPIPLHQQPVFKAYYPDSQLPVAEASAASCLSLPMFPELSDEQIARVAAAVKHALIQ